MTVPPAFQTKLIDHRNSREWVRQFEADAQAAAGDPLLDRRYAG